MFCDRCWCSFVQLLLVDALELDLEDQCGIGWDESREAPVSVRHLARDGQNASLAQRHPRDALIPTCNHSADTDGCLEVSTAD